MSARTGAAPARGPQPAAGRRRPARPVWGTAAAIATACLLATEVRAEPWQLTPRVQKYYDNNVQRQSGLEQLRSAEFANRLNESLFARFQEIFGAGTTYRVEEAAGATSGRSTVDMGGVAVLVPWPDRPAWQISASLLAGSGSFDSTEQKYWTSALEAPGVRVTDLETAISTTRTSLQRKDLELGLQRRLSERAALLIGLRAEFSDLHATTHSSYESSINLLNLPAVLLGEPAALGLRTNTFLKDARQTLRVYSLRFGGAAFAELGDRHAFFVQALLNVSHQPAAGAVQLTTHLSASSGVPGLVATLQPASTQVGESASETSIGPDLTVGYQYRISERLAVDLRYRATLYFPVDGRYDFADPRVNHGAALGFTMRIGD